MDVKDRIKKRRLELGLTFEQVGNYVGVSKSTVKKWESGSIPNMRRDKIAKLSEILEISPVELMGWEKQVQPPESPPSTPTIPFGYSPIPPMEEVPLVGDIACGTPILAEENVIGRVSVPDYWHATFVLTCHGDSMAPKIMDGDLVAIHAQQQVENGQIAAVRIGDEATLKRVYRYPDRLELRAINPDYESIFLFGEDINNASIDGRAIGLCRGL